MAIIFPDSPGRPGQSLSLESFKGACPPPIFERFRCSIESFFAGCKGGSFEEVRFQEHSGSLCVRGHFCIQNIASCPDKNSYFKYFWALSNKPKKDRYGETHFHENPFIAGLSYEISKLSEEDKNKLTTLVGLLHGEEQSGLWEAPEYSLDPQKVAVAIKVLAELKKNPSLPTLYSCLENLGKEFCRSPSKEGEKLYSLYEMYWRLDGKKEEPFYGQRHFGEKPFLVGLSLLLTGRQEELPKDIENHPLQKLFSTIGFPPAIPLEDSLLLMNALEEDNFSYAQFLLLWGGADPNISKESLSALHVASLKGQIDLVKLLLKAGASAKAKDVNGNTPLHMAAYNGHVEVIQALLGAGASVEAENAESNTPLHAAAHKGHVEAIKALRDGGASLTHVNNRGVLPYSLAFYRGDDECAALLLDTEGKVRSFFEKWDAIKKMALMAGIDGSCSLEEKTFDLAGFIGGNIFLAPFIDLFSGEQKKIKTACQQAINPKRSPEEIVESIQRGDLVILYAGARNHSMHFVFSHGFLVICNRGRRTLRAPTMQAYPINPKKFSKETLQRILDLAEKDYRNSDVEKSIYLDMVRSLSVDGATDSWRKETCTNLISLSSKLQKAGNCTAASAKMAIRACLALVEHKKTGMLTKKRLNNVKVQSKVLTLAAREKLEAECESICVGVVPDAPRLISEARGKRMRIATRHPEIVWS